jgi:hypothetical protein
MRVAAGLVAALLLTAPLRGQERDRSLERIAIALQQPPGSISSTSPSEPLHRPLELGPFTLVPPEMRGEFVRVQLPIGELVTRAVRGVRAAHERRRQAKARREVETALKAFLEQTRQQPW